jgi:MFS-type transporter involved in bile tolerance (Atg22 family)
MQTDPAKDVLAAGRRTRFAWYAYDLGNTTVEFAIPLYLTIWIVEDLGVAAWVFGLASAVSSWAIGLSGPYIGVRADERHSRRLWFTVSAIISVMLLGVIGFLPHSGTMAIVLILVIAMAANYFFQLSSLVYNASMLTAARGANVVSVSSMGIGLSYLGGLVGVGIIAALVSGHLIPGVSGRSYAIMPAALIFLACAIPGFRSRGLWQKDSDPVRAPSGGLHRRIRELWRESSRQYRAGWFLAGFFALNSSIMGLTLYLPLYVRAVTGLEGTGLAVMFGIVVLTSAVGAGIVTLMRPTGRTVRRILLVGLTLLGINALAFSLVESMPLVVLCACLHGLFSGALVPTARGAFAQTFRSDYQALAFGLFGAVQRVSQGLGATLEPLASAATGGTATAAGIAVMGALALIGVPLFSRWRFPAGDVVPPGE